MVIVKGAIGRTDRENRDNMRVFSRGGVLANIKIAHSERTDKGTKKV